MFGKVIGGTAILVIVLLSVSASFAKADAVVIRSTEGSIQDFNKTTVVEIPTTSKVCTWEQSTGTGEGLLGGAIIGGILGEIFGGGDVGTRNAGAAFGAIVGGNEAQSSGQVKVCKDVTTYHSEIKTEYSHSIITFYENGKRYQLKFIR